MINIVIVIALIIQWVASRYSRKVSAILGFVIVLGILVWAQLIYFGGGLVAFFGVPLTQFWFLAIWLLWFGLVLRELRIALSGSENRKLWSWVWFLLGTVYFLVPLYATLRHSLRMERDVIGFKAYVRAFEDNDFWETFLLSNGLAVATIIASVILIVPTAYWIRLRLPQARRITEFITLLPFVIPAIILVFGLIRIYSAPIGIPFTGIEFFQPLTTTKLGTYALITAGYMVLAMPYMYRSVDTGMRTVDIRTLTEAAQSLGAGWYTIITQVILPNVRSALLSGALLTFAIVVGEVTLASFLGVDAFGPYLFLIGQHRAYEPAALSFVTFLLTWLAMGMIQLVTGGQGQAAGAH